MCPGERCCYYNMDLFSIYKQEPTNSSAKFLLSVNREETIMKG